MAICTSPVVSSIKARYCGRCGRPVLFDPSTLRPWHEPTDAARSIHDEEVNALCERVASSWVTRALSGTLPAKEYAR